MSRLFVPGTEQPRLEGGRSSIGTDGLGWLTPGRTGGGISMSTGGTTTSGSGSGSEADLPESEYGPLESDDEDRLSATGLFCTKNQAGENAAAKIRKAARSTTSESYY